jgi:hypothetical protein
MVPRRIVKGLRPDPNMTVQVKCIPQIDSQATLIYFITWDTAIL